MPSPTGWFEYATIFETILVLFLGALLGFSLTGLQGQLDRDRRRESLSSALLVELRTLEHALSLWYEDERAAEARGKILTPVFDKFSGDLLLIRKECLYRILHFYSFVADVNEHLVNARARLDRGEVLGVNDSLPARFKAQFALASISAAREALEKQGGILPPRSPDHGRRFDVLPPAPPKSFDNYPDD